MTMTARDRRTLTYAVPVILVMAVSLAYLIFGDGSSAPVQAQENATPESVEMAEQRLARLRDIAATSPAKQDILKKVGAELATRETGLIRADTVQQAQAQVIAILRGLADSEAPTVEIRSMEPGPVESLAGAYGLAPVRFQFECGMAQLLNVLAGLASRPELIATRDLQIQAGNPMNKTVRVALTVAAVVPKELVPDKGGKGGAGL